MAWSLSGTTTKVRLWSLLLSVLCAALIVFHGFRGEWYATAGALPVIVVLSAVGQRKVIGKGLLLVAIAVGLVAMLGILSPYVFAYSPVESVIDRALSPFEIGGADSSLTSRLEEVQWAWPQILVRPILGWGVAVPVNPVLLRLGMVAYGVHSGYMYLLLNYGFVGLVASLWLMASYFRYAWRTLGLVQNTSQRALIVGFMGYTAHMLLTGFINTGFAGASGMVLLSIGFVLTVVLGERARQASIAASAVQCSPQKSLLAPRS
jgi:O-antigen ligase